MRLPQLKSRFRTAIPGTWPSRPGAGVAQQDIERFGVTLRFATAERIFAEGFHADRVYRVVSGFVRLCMRNPENQVIADFMLPGNWLGLFDRTAYGFSAEAASNVVLRSYLKRDAEYFFASARGVALMAEAKRLLSETVGYRTALPGQAPDERMISFLDRISRRLQINVDDPLALPLSTHDIARHLGLTDEAVSRELAALKRPRVPIVSREEKVLDFSTPESLPVRAIASDASQQDRAVQFIVPDTGARLDRSQSPALA
jgi:CRP-like cAMP-binding protein